MNAHGLVLLRVSVHASWKCLLAFLGCSCLKSLLFTLFSIDGCWVFRGWLWFLIDSLACAFDSSLVWTFPWLESNSFVVVLVDSSPCACTSDLVNFIGVGLFRLLCISNPWAQRVYAYCCIGLWLLQCYQFIVHLPICCMPPWLLTFVCLHTGAIV